MKDRSSLFSGSPLDVATRIGITFVEADQSLLYWLVKNEPALDAALFAADHLSLENRVIYASHLPLLEHILEKRPRLLPTVQTEFLLTQPVLIDSLLLVAKEDWFHPVGNIHDCCRALAINRPDVAKILLGDQSLEVIDTDFLSAFCWNFDPAKGELSAKIFRGSPSPPLHSSLSPSSS